MRKPSLLTPPDTVIDPERVNLAEDTEYVGCKHFYVGPSSVCHPLMRRDNEAMILALTSIADEVVHDLDDAIPIPSDVGHVANLVDHFHLP